MSEFQLAQINIARLAAPIDSPQLEGFVSNLERINALAEASPGFVWRLQTEDGDATSIDHFGPDMLVNMSVWEDVESLKAFTYDTAHAAILRRRKEWFEAMTERYMVLWWVPAGHEPSLAEAEDRLNRLREHGPTREAFTFREPFGPPDAK